MNSPSVSRSQDSIAIGRRWAMGAISTGLAFVFSLPLLAQAQSTAEMLEQARARAQEIEDLKRALNSPDQNMRIATFEIMISHKEDSIRELALDTGLGSADRLLQALAFKSAIMGLDQLHLTLEVDESQPEEVQERSRARIAEKGDKYVINIGYHDLKTGVFAGHKNYAAPGSVSRGEVSGTRITFIWTSRKHTGDLQLDGDDSIVGTLQAGGTRPTHFKASAQIR